jgi:filamentous hemagglutinin
MISSAIVGTLVGYPFGYSLDTQHGEWEKINPKNGSHEGVFDLFDTNKQIKPVDLTGKHDLKVK